MAKKIQTSIAEKTIEDKNETTLRPQTLNDYIGQSENKKMLETSIKAAQKQGINFPHTLLYGPPGLGKTTLANILANEMKSKIKYVAGPAIEKPGDIVALLTQLEDNDILFIDEIHRINKAAEEVLYSAMEDYFIVITIGEGPQQKQMHFSLPKFTLIGATTRAGMLSQPLRDRFGISCKMEYYTNEELMQIIMRTASVLKIELFEDAANIVARCSRGTPRIANRVIARINDYVLANDIKNGNITTSIIIDALNTYRINSDGLDTTDMKILAVLADHSIPVGLETLACLVGEDAETIEAVYEPYLLLCNYIEKTPRGRVIMEKGVNVLKLHNYI